MATPSSIAETIAPRGGFNVENLWERVWAALVALRPYDGWASVLLLALNLSTIVWSVERADWAPTPNLVYVMLLGMVTGLVLSRVPVWGILLLPVGLAVGLLVVVWQLTSFRADGMELANAAELWERLYLWYEAARIGTINIDTVPFAFGLMSATWLSGYLAAWVFFRFRNFWGVFILGGAGILSNLTYLPDTASIDLAVYLLTALLLVGRVQSVRRRNEWKRRNFQYDGHLGWLAISDTVLIGTAVMIAAFLLPTGASWGPTHDVYERMRGPIAQWEDDFNRLFAGLPARRPLPYRIWGDSIAFQGTINPTTNPVLQVNSPVPMYWKARSYGTYTPKGWVSAGTVYKTTDWSPQFSVSAPYQQRFDVTYAVTPRYDSKNLFAGGQVLGVDRDARVETYDSPIYELDLTQLSFGTFPNDQHPRLGTARANLELAVRQQGGLISDSALAQELPAGLDLLEVARQENVVQSVLLVEIIPEQPDTLSLRAASGNVKQGETYQVTSSVSLAQPHHLRRAGQNYPIWAVEKYTQLPDGLPQRVRDLAASVTADAHTPYDKAKAIEDYLKTYNYNLSIKPPPFNADGVDFFLFEQKEGYSEYFGSAMTVMLRSIGIPARLATGYTVGNQVPDHEIYVVADSHSHAWSEAFFPGYGWISFEPTPGASIPIATVPVPKESPSLVDAGSVGFDVLCEDDEDECEENAANRAGQNFTDTGEALSLGQWVARYFPWIMAAIAITLLLAGLGWAFWRRCLALAGTPEATFRQLAFLGALNSVGIAGHQTPYQYGQRLETVFPDHRDSLATIIGAYVRSQYGKKDLTETERDGLVQAWLAVRMPLLFHMLRRRENEPA